MRSTIPHERGMICQSRACANHLIIVQIQPRKPVLNRSHYTAQKNWCTPWYTCHSMRRGRGGGGARCQQMTRTPSLSLHELEPAHFVLAAEPAEKRHPRVHRLRRQTLKKQKFSTPKQACKAEGGKDGRRATRRKTMGCEKKRREFGMPTREFGMTTTELWGKQDGKLGWESGKHEIARWSRIPGYRHRKQWVRRRCRYHTDTEIPNTVIRYVFRYGICHPSLPPQGI